MAPFFLSAAAAASSEPTLFSSDKWLPSMRQKRSSLKIYFNRFLEVDHRTGDVGANGLLEF